MVLAIKYNDDIYADNTVYSMIGGVSLSEMNSLESELLALLKYKLFVESREYMEYADGIRRKLEEIEEEETQPMSIEEISSDELERVKDSYGDEQIWRENNVW